MHTTAQRPKYHQIREELSRQIISGVLAQGEQIPSEQELATHYGVSRLTIRQAISQLSSEGVIQTIQGKGSFVAGSFKANEINLKTIHLVATSFHEPPCEDAFLGPLLLQLCHHANQKNLSITSSLLPRHQSFGDYLRRDGIPATFRNGVIIANVPVAEADLLLLRNEKIPYVIIPRGDNDDTEAETLPEVGTDDPKGIRLCVESLLQYGHRDIALIACHPGNHAFRAVLDTYRQILEKAGLPFQAELVVNTIPWEEEEGRKSMAKLLERGCRFTGLICSGDKASVGAVKLLRERGCRIPEDLSVVVFDRYPWMDSLFPFRFTGTQTNLSGLALETLNLLEEQRTGGTVIAHRRMVAPDLIIGNSCQYVDFNN